MHEGGFHCVGVGLAYTKGEGVAKDMAGAAAGCMQLGYALHYGNGHRETEIIDRHARQLLS